MRTSALTHRIAFERRALFDDGYGNKRGEFGLVFEAQAGIQARMGGEAVLAERLAGRQPVTIRVRQSTGAREVTTDWRIRDVRTGTLYNIRAITDPFSHTAERGRYFDILAESGVAT